MDKRIELLPETVFILRLADVAKISICEAGDVLETMRPYLHRVCTTPTLPVGQVGTAQVQNDTKLNLSPAGQVEAVNRAFQLLHNRGFEGEARALMDAVDALKASGAEHIAGLVEALERMLGYSMMSEMWQDSDDGKLCIDKAKQALQALPPELRGK